MASSTRFVMVDDTDTSIQYDGAWFIDQGSKDGLGTYGPEYNHSLHGSMTYGDSLTFAFNGTSLVVYGSIDAQTQSPPSWDCFVDEVYVESAPLPTITEYLNFCVLCNLSQVADGSHTAMVNVTSFNSTFWFDAFSYQPSPNAMLDAATIQVDNADPAFSYGDGWYDWAGVARYTTTASASMNFTYNGTIASLVGVLANGIPSSATYSIDGATPVTFSPPDPPSSTLSNLENQILYTTPHMSPGVHSVVVTYPSPANTSAPLIVSYLFVTTSTGDSTPDRPFTVSSTSVYTYAPTSTQVTPLGASKSSVSAGTIFGCVVGGVILIAFITIIIYWWRRRQHENPKRSGEYLYQASGTSDISSLLRVFKPFRSEARASVTPFVLRDEGVRAPSRDWKPKNQADFEQATLIAVSRGETSGRASRRTGSPFPNPFGIMSATTSSLPGRSMTFNYSWAVNFEQDEELIEPPPYVLGQ